MGGDVPGCESIACLRWFGLLRPRGRPVDSVSISRRSWALEIQTAGESFACGGPFEPGPWLVVCARRGPSSLCGRAAFKQARHGQQPTTTPTNAADPCAGRPAGRRPEEASQQAKQQAKPTHTSAPSTGPSPKRGGKKREKKEEKRQPAPGLVFWLALLSYLLSLGGRLLFFLVCCSVPFVAVVPSRRCCASRLLGPTDTKKKKRFRSFPPLAACLLIRHLQYHRQTGRAGGRLRARRRSRPRGRRPWARRPPGRAP